MKDNPDSHEAQVMKELLQRYQKFRAGGEFLYLEEEAFERIIDYYDETDQLAHAIEAADTGIRQFPYSSLLLIKKADLLIAKQSFSEALDILDKVSVLDSKDINLYILKIDACLGLGDQATAREIFKESAELFDGHDKTELLFEVAEVFDDYGLFDEVFECLRMILMIDPQSEEALFKICFWTDYAGKFEESIELHKKLIDETPYNYLAWFNLGTAYQGLNLHEKAIDAYLYAIAINEKFDYAYRNLGDAYICLKNYKEAIEALEKVLELTIPEDVIYEALGHCYEKLKDAHMARANYRKALHMNPEDSHLYYRIAATYIMQEKWNHAVDQLEQAVKIEGNKKPDYFLVLGQCLSKTGNFQEAVDFLVKYITARPSAIKGWKELLTVLFEFEYYEEAFHECDTAFRQTNGKPVFIYFKAACALKLGKRKEGLALLETALQEAPKNLKEFVSLDPGFLQRASIVSVINRHHQKKGKKNKKGRL